MVDVPTKITEPAVLLDTPDGYFVSDGTDETVLGKLKEHGSVLVTVESVVTSVGVPLLVNEDTSEVT